MRLGFVYDAKADYLGRGLSAEALAEFDSEETISSLCTIFADLGFTVDRIGHLQHLVARLAAGERWDIVFNLAEGLYGPAREATVPALLDAYRIPYTFADAVTMAVTLDKSLAKRLVAAAGIPTASYAVIHTEAELASLHLPYPLFAKPLAEGSGKGVLAASHVTDAEALRMVTRELLARFHQPVLVESYLPGREFTVGILGNGADAQVIAVAEIGLLTGADGQYNSFHNKQEALETYTLATDAEARRAGEVALAAWQVLGGRDAGRMDIRSDAEGTPHFLELNPLAGLQPGYSELPILAELAGISHARLIESILRNSLERHGLPWPSMQQRQRS